MANQGVTESERYLGKLCRSSFLSLWSYQGLYRDQGGGKEICDLLVVFGNHVLIFSDKYCEFPDTGNLQTDWSRWYKKAIEKSAKQIWGAERWLKEHPDRIFLDRKCTQKFPLDLPSRDSMQVHRIAVAHGAGERCYQYFESGSGSLMINNSLIGKDHYMSPLQGGMPFAIGLIDNNKGYVHVLDDTSLEIVLKNLDTIADFIAYLEKKEHLLENHSVLAAGEEELLGMYLSDVNENEENDFVFTNNPSHVIVPEGFWQEFLVSAERKAMIRANEISYAWDHLIEQFSYHIATNTQYHTTHPGDINRNERIVRFMAAEPRTRRRLLARKVIDLITKTPQNYKAASVCIPDRLSPYPYYILLVLPQPYEIGYKEYREGRRKLLEVYCTAVKVRYPEAQNIIGLATKPGIQKYSSEDAIYFDAGDWTTEDQEQAESILRELNLLNSGVEHRITEKTYPDRPRYGRDSRKQKQKIPRNAPCPCGSGLKYKKCCRRKGRN